MAADCNIRRNARGNLCIKQSGSSADGGPAACAQLRSRQSLQLYQHWIQHLDNSLAYGRSAEGIIEQETPIENIIGAGGLLTTVGDLPLWNENFTHAKVGGPDIVKAQQTPAHLTTGGSISYAAGLVVTSMDGHREISHSRSTGGYRTWLGRFPDQGMSVAVLCNCAQANPSKLGWDTARLWTGKAETPMTSVYQADPAKLEAFAGLYRKMRDNTVAELKWRKRPTHSEPCNSPHSIGARPIRGGGHGPTIPLRARNAGPHAGGKFG